MPVQLSTILYISEYREKTPGEFFIGIAIRYTRLEGYMAKDALTSIEGKFYLELHNFSFICINNQNFISKSTKEMPWYSTSSSSPPHEPQNLQSIKKFKNSTCTRKT
ncbi:uncharacterized protein OCT59_001118 [Rhizophagus irregularis]|nr:hypothetical protein OCT59_001118 [Rhizophagus irregularis]